MWWKGVGEWWAIKFQAHIILSVTRIDMPPLCLFYFGKKGNITSLFSKTLKRQLRNLTKSNIAYLLFQKSGIFQKNGMSTRNLVCLREIKIIFTLHWKNASWQSISTHPEKTGYPKVHLFASRANPKLPKHKSEKPDLDFIAIDAFSVTWNPL